MARRNQAVTLALLVSVALSGCASQSVDSLSASQLEQAAKDGDAQAQYRLAQQLAARKEYPRAMALMQQVGDRSMISSLSQEQRAEASRQVGDWYNVGLGEPRNLPLALKWWRRASSLGNGQASWQLAQHCQQQHEGKLVADCIDTVDTAAGQGNAAAQLALAQWYASHQGAEQDALSWLEKAASQEDPQAQYQLATRYEQGNGVDQRSDMAQRLYYQSASHGYPPAQRWMGAHSSGGEALAWYQKAATANDAASQRWLAQAYFSGKGVALNEHSGQAWLLKAVNGGDAEAQYLYSQRLSDDEARERYLRQSAAGDYLPAQQALAKLYMTRDDQILAREAWQTLADGGDTQARYELGEMLRLGQGGKEDFARAFKQYRLAALKDQRMAQYRMGMMRQEGLGAPRNRIHAYAWYSLAATEGMKEALAALNDVEATMQPQEIKTAQTLAQLWRKRIASGAMPQDDSDEAGNPAA